MITRSSYFLARILATCILVFSSTSFAGQWKPLCAEDGICRLGPFYAILDPHSVSPPVTSEGFLVHYRPISYSSRSRRELLLVSGQSIENIGFIENMADSYASDQNTVELPGGIKKNFSLYRVASWQDSQEEPEYINWSGQSVLNLNGKTFTGPPVAIDDAVFVGIYGGGQYIYVQEGEGQFWKQNRSNIRLGDDRYNLLTNPERTALWAMTSDNLGPRSRLYESTDQGINWVYVDDGSFPPETMRIVHDPDDTYTSYALTGHGLFVSEDRGASWQASSWTQAVHSLVVVVRDEPLSRAIVIGTDSGIKVSTDEMLSWEDMSRGLLAQPHSVTYGHNQLVATSDSGYFTCDTMDCFGAGQSLPTDQKPDLVNVVEFYHPDLDHYFITATEEEATAIDQGAAGPGWVRTGEKFLTWSLGEGNSDASNVCRFYGSMNPGPNSHFYSVSQPECRFLMDLQELVPDHRPRWNFEGYAFSILPPAPDAQQPCPDTAIPVYRAYNDAYRKGEDSNHRYMTDLKLMDEMVAKGWIDEGVAFCSPTK